MRAGVMSGAFGVFLVRAALHLGDLRLKHRGHHALVRLALLTDGHHL